MKSVLIKKSEIDRTLSNEPTEGKKLLEPLKSIAGSKNFPANILENKNIVNKGEVHERESDLWICLEGEVIFICGGKLKNPILVRDGEWQAEEIEGGTEMILYPSDWLWVPAGELHQHKTTGVARLVIIKIPFIRN